MKKIRYIFLSILSIAALFSCSDREDIRNDIDNLNTRLDKLEAQLPQMNEAIANYQGLINGKYMIVGYTPKDDGDYVLELSNGESLTVNVYSGKVTEEDLPLIEIRDGYWYYKYPGDTDYSPLTGDDGQPVKATIDGKTPTFQINDNGYWEYSWNGEDWIGGIGPANPDKAFSSLFSKVDVSDDGNTITLEWADGTVTIPVFEGLSIEISNDNSTSFFLGETKQWVIKQGEKVSKIVIETVDWKIKVDETMMTVTAPSENSFGKEYNYTLVLKIFSEEGYCRAVTIPVTLLTTKDYENSATAWQNFLSGEDNVLLDYSYAGYMHGEVAPPDVYIDFANPKTDNSGNKYYNANIIGGAQGSAVYKVYNIEDYGAKGNDELSDRDALDKILKNAINCTRIDTEDNGNTYRYYVKGSDNANAIIYFPEGKFILRGGTENEKITTLRFTMGNIIFKGAGRDKTIIEMAEENEMTNPDEKWSAANLLEFKNNSGLSDITTVKGDAEKGSFSVEVSSTSGISKGDWICLSLKNNDSELIAEELSPYTVSSAWTDMTGNGVQIYDYHQIKSISGNVLTFYEPIMRKVEAKWGWKIQKYPHYENVGVEDLKILGHAHEGFKHHGDNNDDGAFKPIQMIRLTNSWMRRVDFESVSEAHSFVNCANVSAYDIEISGNRGHSAIRSQASSRVFIGKVYDYSNGYIALDTGGSTLGEYMEGAGQYHACGVSKQSMGAVIWNVNWGRDACFESHATQPRATLIDMCTGGFMPWREGGDINQLPNHLNDLTIWNMTATRVNYHNTWGNKFLWWDEGNDWWKNLPPIIVGWGGQTVEFDTSEKQLKYYESLNGLVEPVSLYEAQLKNRLGYVPAWLNALK